jgi:hypothetical protein
MQTYFLFPFIFKYICFFVLFGLFISIRVFLYASITGVLAEDEEGLMQQVAVPVHELTSKQFRDLKITHVSKNSVP